MFTDSFDQIEKRNPYKMDDDENLLSRDIVQQALQLQRKAYIVKFIAIIDLVSNIIYGLYGYFMYIIFTICSGCGYASTVTYNRSLLLFYLIYQYLQIAFKFFNFILFIVLASCSDFRDYIENYTDANSTSNFNVNNLNYGYLVPLSGLLLYKYL